MNDTGPVVEKALEWIQKISGEIGPRPAGSRQEAAAGQMLADHLQAAGYQAVWQEFDYPAIPRYFPYFALPGAIFLIGALFSDAWRAILVVLPFLVAGLPGIYTWLADRLPRRSHSRNLILTPAGTVVADTDIILCAHIDSAHIAPRPPRLLMPVFRNFMQLLELAAWLAAFIGLIHLTIPLAAWAFYPLTTFFLAFSGFFLIVVDLWQQLAGSRQVTRGANDNASGAALCTALAEYWSEHPIRNRKVGYIFTGAEEDGLYGASAAASHLPWGDVKPFILNLDMVGLGRRIGVVTRYGRLQPRTTDPQILEYIEALHPDILKVDYRYRGGDFIPFRKQGFRAISLEATDRGGVPPTYHSLNDDPDHIDPLILAKITDVVMEVAVGVK